MLPSDATRPLLPYRIQQFPYLVRCHTHTHTSDTNTLSQTVFSMCNEIFTLGYENCQHSGHTDRNIRFSMLQHRYYTYVKPGTITALSNFPMWIPDSSRFSTSALLRPASFLPISALNGPIKFNYNIINPFTVRFVPLITHLQRSGLPVH